MQREFPSLLSLQRQSLEVSWLYLFLLFHHFLFISITFIINVLRTAYHIPSLFLLSPTPIPFASCLRFSGSSVTTEPAQNALSHLMRHRAALQRNQIKITSHAVEACAQERTWTSSCTWNQSLPCIPPYETKGPGLNQNLNTKPIFRSNGPLSRKTGADVPYHEWLGSKVLQLKLALSVFPHTCSP